MIASGDFSGEKYLLEEFSDRDHGHYDEIQHLDNVHQYSHDGIQYDGGHPLLTSDAHYARIPTQKYCDASYDCVIHHSYDANEYLHPRVTALP